MASTTIKLKDGISQEDLIKVETEMRRQYPNAVNKISDSQYQLPGDLDKKGFGGLASLIQGFAVTPKPATKPVKAAETAKKEE